MCFLYKIAYDDGYRRWISLLISQCSEVLLKIGVADN